MAKVVLFGNLAESIINFRGPILRAMVEAGHDVYVITPPYELGSKNELSNLGVSHCPIPLHRTSLNPFHDLRTLFVLFQLLHRIKPEYLLSYTLKPVFLWCYSLQTSRNPFLSNACGIGLHSRLHLCKRSKINLKGAIALANYFYVL